MIFKNVMGLDLSLTATGIAAFYNRETRDTGELLWQTAHVGYSMSTEEHAHPVHQLKLWQNNIVVIKRFVREFGITEIAIEGHAFSRFPNNRLVEYIGAVKWALWKDKDTSSTLTNIRVVQPSEARKYLMGRSVMKVETRQPGKKRTVKDVVHDYLKARGIDIKDHNERDAWVIGNWLRGKVNGDQFALCVAQTALL